MAYHSKFTGKQVDDILDSVSGKQDKLSETNQVEKGWIAEYAVEEKNVAVDAITTDKIKNWSVTADKIKPLTITHTRIADSAVRLRHLNRDVQQGIVETFSFSTENVANWSGTDAQFKTTFGVALSVIINHASERTIKIDFTYRGVRHKAMACSFSASGIRSISFLIHNPEGLTELISMNLDDDNVTVTNETLVGGSERSDFYLLPPPDFEDFVVGAEVRGWTKAVFKSANSAKDRGAKLVCDMTDYMNNPCYAPALMGGGLGDIQYIHISALSSLANEDGSITLNALEISVRHDYATGKTTIVGIWNNTMTISEKSADPYVVVASGLLDNGFSHLTQNPTTYDTPTQFERQFGFAFTDLMQAVDKPLLLKTKDVDGTKITMHATSCINDGNKMCVYFMSNDVVYYSRSTDGGQTITVGYTPLMASLA